VNTAVLATSTYFYDMDGVPLKETCKNVF